MRTTSSILLSSEDLEDEISTVRGPRVARGIERNSEAASIAHDLNNVLSLIAMAAELLGSRELGAEEQRFLTIIEDGTARGQGISRRLFELVKGTKA